MSGEIQPDPAAADSLILVDSNDEIVGHRPKVDCHLGDGTLHRAFSVFLFDDEGRLLLQQRSRHKMLWPMFWSNSCCSHPREGEETDEAAVRRVQEELGITASLKWLYKFEYQAPFGDVGSENELCHVYAGRFSGEVITDPHEIAATRLIDARELADAIAADPDSYTPWLKMEWQEITSRFLDDILA